MRRKISAGRLVGALFLSLQLAACSYNVQTSRLEDAPPADIPPAHELTETPFFPQKRYQCGPAALATVLVAEGVEARPDALVDKVYLPEREGSVPIEMDAAGRSFDMLVYPLDADLKAVFTEVAAGHPVIVLQNLGLSWYPRWHYAVVVGYDLGEGQVILRSGVTKRYREAMAVFETTWRRSHYWARVVLPAGAMPATATPLKYARASLALEQSGHKGAALGSYRAATRYWPDSPINWMALGNLAYDMGRYREAEQAFRGAVAASPSSADGWNNLAYALNARGCQQQANEAVECAVSLMPDNAAYRDSQSELRASPQRGGRCEVVTCPPSLPKQ